MAKDWKWGCIGLLPGIIVALLLTDYLRSFGGFTGWGIVAAWVGLACIAATALLVVINRRSVSRLKAAGRPAQLIVRPFQAVMEAPEKCATIFGAIALVKLTFSGEIGQWQASLIVSSVWGYVMALVETAYAAPSETSEVP